MKVRPGRYIVTYAMNGTPVHKKFFASLRNYPGKLLVIAGRYKNPTSIFADADREGDWWAPEVLPFITGRFSPCPNLCIYGDISIQPTATRPLNGWEVFCGSNSGIFGHPKLALETIATATRMPRLLLSTGACTVPNYTQSRAGKQADAHHTLGAVVVEVEPSGAYHLRHISASARTGEFTDLDTVYSPNGARPASRAAGLTLGDIHVGRIETPVLQATKHLFLLVRPRHLVLHDVLDMESGNPHAQSVWSRARRQSQSVMSEVYAACRWVQHTQVWPIGFTKPFRFETHVIQSNHDDMLERWLDDAKPERLSPEDLRYYHELWAARLRNPPAIDLFASEYDRWAAFHKWPARGVTFHSDEDPVMIGDVSHGFHGHRGAAGGKGNPNVYAKLGVKTTTDHTHVPSRRDGNCTGGVTASLNHGYNRKPSAWLNTHVVQYADNKRTHVHIINGRFCAPELKAAA